MNETNKNYITGIILISNEDLNKDIRIVNTYDRYKRDNLGFAKQNYINNNEREIINKCQIKIDNISIPFSFFHKFKKCGKFIIEYSFEGCLTNTSSLFYDCKNITSLDLSHFNTEHITNMSLMFGGCESLTELNLINFNTKSVIKMRHMFSGCKSLKYLDLSYFNTSNVIDMTCMFCDCKSLTNLDLSNFNTQKVTSLSGMISDCESLIDLDISNFNTKNVEDADRAISHCPSLKNIRLKDVSRKSQSSKFMLHISRYWKIINSHDPNFNFYSIKK